MPAAQLPFLDDEHPTYTEKKDGWERDERRLLGGDPLFNTELEFFRNENDGSKKLRKATARYTNFADLHLTTLVGHLSSKGPEYSYGKLGPVRPLKDLGAQEEKLHELFHYNCDGIGSDGSQYPAWRDGVKYRAGATGVRWVMAEMPTLEDLLDIRRRLAPEGATISEEITFTEEEQRAGYRVFLREYSPLDVHNWKFSRSGVLLWAVIWVPIEQDKDVDESGATVKSEMGRYLLVRKGYEGLGTAFSEGGWWLFDKDHEELDHVAGWLGTAGEIPLWRMFSLKDDGTTLHPSMGRSLTTDLGQIAVDLMNARSEQRYNLRQAAKTITYILGITEKEHGGIVDQLEDQSIVIWVPGVQQKDGSVAIPTIWNSSQAAMDATAFQTVLDGGLNEAREIMVKQITSAPESSGASKMAGFEEATSPLLAGLAETSEEFDNTMLHFVLQLMGQKPDASVTWPRKFKLRDVIDDVDSLLDSIKKAGLDAPTLEIKAIVVKATEMGLMDDDTERKKIIAELIDSADTREERASQEAGLFGEIAAAGRNRAPRGEAPAPPPPAPPA